jgi:hypothetical protein
MLTHSAPLHTRDLVLGAVLLVSGCMGTGDDTPVRPAQAPSVACEGDDDCAFSKNSCCTGCGALHPRVVSSGKARRERMANWFWCTFEDCPDIGCISMPSCNATHSPRCISGECVAVPELGPDCEDCEKPCGPFPPEGLSCGVHEAEDLWLACCARSRDEDPSARCDRPCTVDDVAEVPLALRTACGPE